MSELAPAERVSAAQTVAAALVDDWTGGSFELLESTAAEFLRAELRSAFGEAGSVRRLAASAGLLDVGRTWIETADDGPGQPMPNPFLMAAQPSIVASWDIQYLAGKSHGDLHEDNILIPREDGVPQPGQFRLVDLSTFDRAAPLSRDLAMMAVSFAARQIPGLPPRQRESLLRYLVSRTAESATGLSADVRQVVDAFRYARSARFTAAGLEDNWQTQLLLSVQATALQHLAFETLDENTRWWLFRLAARAGGEFLRLGQQFHPDNPGLVDRSILTAGREARPRFAAVDRESAAQHESWVDQVPLTVGDKYRRSLVIVAPATHGAATGRSEQADRSDLTAVIGSFAALGYQCAAGHVIQADEAGELRDPLSDVLEAMGPADVVALYVAGAMEILSPGTTSRRLVLRTARSQPGRERGTVSVEALLEGIYDRRPEERPCHLSVILDVATAENAGVLVRELSAALPPLRPDDATVPVGTYALAVTRPRDAQWTPSFPDALRDVAMLPAVASRAAPYLDLAAVTDEVRARLGRQQDIEVSAVSQRGPNRCFPNPRHHVGGIDPADLAEWWEPTARGISGAAHPRATGEAPWLFSGRHRLNREIARWLGSPGEPTLVLTGAPGSGKSTVLARTVVATVPDIRHALEDQPDALRPQETPPAGFRFAIAIRANRLTADEVAERIATVVGSPALAGPPSGPAVAGPASVILIDGVDEADDPHRLVAEVLRPLALVAADGGPRLLVATRSQPVGHDPADPLAVQGDLVTPLVAEGGAALDVGSPDWLETGDIAEYCDRLLSVPVNDAGRANPYATAPDQRRILARSIETEAGHSFLLAAHVARRHTLDAEPTDPQSPRWIEQFPRRIGDAMRQEIEAVYGVVEAGRQLALLRPLAFAEGAGLIRAGEGPDLWARLASRLDPEARQFTAADVDELLRDRVATHLVAQADKGGLTAYRFHHEALAESFIARRADRAAADRIIAEVVLAELGPAAKRDWSRLGPYAVRALPGHAQRGGLLRSLTGDAGLYMYSDPDRLHEALVTAAEPTLTARSRLIRPYLHRLRVLGPSQRAFLLSIAAKVTGDEAIAARLAAAADLPVETRHVRVRHEALRQALAEGQPVGALAATAARDGSPLVFIANGRFIDVRDPDSGALVETVLSGLDEIAAMVPYLDADGFPVVAAAAADGVKVWDASTRALRGAADVDFGRGMVLGHHAGVPFLAGWSDEQVAVWDAKTGGKVTVLPVRWEPGEQPITSVTVVCDQSGTDQLAIAAGGKVGIWDPATARQTDSADLPAGEFNVQLAALQPGRPDGLLLVTTGLNDRRGLLWQSSLGTRDWPFSSVPICTATWSAGGAEQVLLGYSTGQVELWDPTASESPRRLQDAGLTMFAAEIGPPGSANPAAVAIDVFGEIRVWDLDSVDHSVTLAGSMPHALGMGRLRKGGRYLVVGRNDGADLWRLDEAGQDWEARDLHDNDALRIVAASYDGAAPFVTAGNDGRLQVWDGGSGEAVASLLIPTGYPQDVTGWTTSGSRMSAVTAAGHLLVFRVDPRPRLLVSREFSDPGRMAYLSQGETGLLAVADRQQVQLIDPASADVRHLPVPLEQERSAAVRNVVCLTWVQPPGADPVLIAGTQGGLLVAWQLRDGGPGEPVLLADDLSTVIMLHQYPGQGGALVLAGSTSGQLRVYDAVQGRQVADLSKDDARIIGAVLVPSVGRVVTAHVAGNANGLRIWDPETGEQVRSVVRGGTGYTGVPRAGMTRLGRPFVAYATEDGIELLWLDAVSSGPPPVRLSLPVTVNDVDVRDDLVYVAGGSGYLMLQVTDSARRTLRSQSTSRGRKGR
jgi:WD40 repeat protein